MSDIKVIEFLNWHVDFCVQKKYLYQIQNVYDSYGKKSFKMLTDIADWVIYCMSEKSWPNSYCKLL